MSTKWGLTALLVGSYLIAFGIAGINANSGGALAFFVVMLILGFVSAGWSIVLPWDGGASMKARAEGAADRDVPTSSPLT
jgi:hypothetical protein